MKKLVTIALSLGLVLAMASASFADEKKPEKKDTAKKKGCTTPGPCAGKAD